MKSAVYSVPFGLWAGKKADRDHQTVQLLIANAKDQLRRDFIADGFLMAETSIRVSWSPEVGRGKVEAVGYKAED